MVIVAERGNSRALDLPRLKQRIAVPVPVERCDVHSREAAEVAGITYTAIGR